MPEGLGRKGSEAWTRILETATWVNKEADRTALEQLCFHLDEREEIKDALKADPTNWRTRNGLRDLDKQISGELATLGLTPADRAKQGVSEPMSDEPLPDYVQSELDKLGITDPLDPLIPVIRNAVLRRRENDALNRVYGF
jgi:hypothetical protein